MPGKKLKKVTTVHEHPLHVHPSKGNPTGITIRHQHTRRIYEAADALDIKKIAASYKKDKLIRPTVGRLPEYPNSDQYDDLIAIWCDYFNKKFPPKPPLAVLDPNLIKALIASESGFIEAPKNRLAFGITQITPETLKILQDPDGEAKNFLFKNILQKDLKDPSLAIPMATRWLFRKQVTAADTLGRSPTPEEIILDYKGLLKSKTRYHDSAIEKFRDAYEKLTAKKQAIFLYFCVNPCRV